MGSHGDTIGRPSQVSNATPLCLLLEVYCNVLVSVYAGLLVRYPELRGVHYSEILFILVIIGGLAGAKARCPLDRSRRPLVGVSIIIRGSTVYMYIFALCKSCFLYECASTGCISGSYINIETPIKPHIHCM